ncbi:MAG TPA: alkaline phosphatase family protein [Bradyrhizobium sp.]|uniref:phospholipase C n=1 Tax=Bradyrhizobium sp. TaxID=376 RepID=UPI002D7FE788|nr:alkaline phosphatase family protein [Bradyrhizobium sp.]HET7889383.1 alkaline phosphatase family protein [Bradyrhizobium sp.]
MKNLKLKSALLSSAAAIVVAATFATSGSVAGNLANELAPVANLIDSITSNAKKGGGTDPNSLKTKTPIKHLIVIFDENRSFDHYFGTYPNALNPEGEPVFEPAKNTPRDINNLLSSPALLDNNPNLNAANGAGAVNPFRLDRTQADTADQSHNYTKEQLAFDGGKNDLFPADVGRGSNGGAGAFGTTGQVMGYFDGNTVTALWNYAQNFAMSDNAYTDTYGPSTPGLLNMWSGQTNGAVFTAPAGAKFFDGSPVPPVGSAAFTTAILAEGDAVPSPDGSPTLIQDIDPTFDICSGPATNLTVGMTSKNIGDLLNAANIPWGSFVGGFALQTINQNGSTGCKLANPGNTGGRSNISSVTGRTVSDYIQHHMWFQYFQSTANPNHVLPASIKEIGHNGPANHAYDLEEFEKAVGAGNFPAVSFIKQSAFQDGHPGNSNSLDEQTGLVNLLNFLQQQEDWDSTAVIFTYDDSDGQYDHVAPAIKSTSFSAADAANGSGNCGVPGTAEPTGLSGQQVAGRCGPGFRIPFLVISPFAKKNYVSHTQITQASVTKFIEDNWLKGERLGGGSFDATTGSIEDMFDFSQKKSTKLILDPTSGLVDSKSKINN